MQDLPNIISLLNVLFLHLITSKNLFHFLFIYLEKPLFKQMCGNQTIYVFYLSYFLSVGLVEGVK